MALEKKDFAALSEAELYAYFTVKKWKGLSRDEKLLAVQEVENRQAALAGRPAIRVFVDSTCTGYILGGYVDQDKSIHLNPEYFKSRFFTAPLFSPAGLLDTIIHEGRHAYQHTLSGTSGISGPAGDMVRVWQLNFPAYIPPAVDLALYFQQAIERDARMFALQEMQRIATLIEPDRQFLASIVQSRQDEYNHILSARSLFPTMEALNKFEARFLRDMQEKRRLGKDIDPRTFRFFSDVRLILELTEAGCKSPKEIFGYLQRNFLRNDYDLSVQLIDRLLQEHPEKLEELQKRKLQLLERNRQWQALLESSGVLGKVGETLEKPDAPGTYRIRV